MSKLLIVESPSKAKTIGKYLGKDFKVLASVGHVRDLPKSNKNAVDVTGGFAPHYEIVKGKEEVVLNLTEAATGADEVILATDPDREGEAIAWHISQILKENLANSKLQKSNSKQIPNHKPPIKRITYHEITKEAVEEALAHPRDIDENLRRAQEARRVLDRLVGYDLSGLIWKKVRYGLSAGRVQSPALRILMEREREIKAFKPETYWTITADTKTPEGIVLTLTCTEEPREKEHVENILSFAKNAPWHVKDVSETETRRAPRAPFTTSTLQQAASSRLGFSPGRTMRAAQKLYEAGHITYMRTDSTTLGTGAKRDIAAAIEKKFGKEFVSLRDYRTATKNAQEAHEAIRPTNVARLSAGAVPDQKKLYELIWTRTIASQMPDATILRTKIVAEVGNGEVPDFTANGSHMRFPGWLLADPASRGEEVELPKVAVDETLTLVEIRADEKRTEPPPRYTEAGLIKELEKRGIGRPSTYATIIETLTERGYVNRENRTLYPTDVGEVVSGFLEEHFPSYISDTFTAEMENELDEIAAGTREYGKTLADFYTPFSKEVKKKEKLAKATDLGDAPGFLCPVCGGSMIWKLSRGGKFISCKKFPKCDGALTAEGKPLPKGDEPIGIHPEMGTPIFVKNGRFGPYVQLGERKKGSKDKPKMASIPKDIDPSSVTVEIAVKLLSLPRTLGVNPKTGKEVVASRGRFGPFVVEDGNFRSLKSPDNPYDVTLERALEILATPKKFPRRVKKARD